MFRFIVAILALIFAANADIGLGYIITICLAAVVLMIWALPDIAE
jgi:hypothetical protein